jgi:hypothetical protein
MLPGARPLRRNRRAAAGRAGRMRQRSRFDAVWFARGGYGAAGSRGCACAAGMPAEHKTWLGYSDAGTCWAGSTRRGSDGGPRIRCPPTCARDGGEAAVRRVFAWLAGDNSGLEPELIDRPARGLQSDDAGDAGGTPLMPGLAGHVVLVEEVAEHLYAVDRLFFHLTAHLGGIAGLRLGRVGDVPENDVEFGQSAEEIARTGARATRSLTSAGRISATMPPTGSCPSGLPAAGGAIGAAPKQESPDASIRISGAGQPEGRHGRGTGRSQRRRARSVSRKSTRRLGQKLSAIMKPKGRKTP